MKDLTPEQKAFALQVSRMVPEEQGVITRYKALENFLRRGEAALVAKRLLVALADDDPLREVIKALLFQRLDELRDV